MTLGTGKTCVDSNRPVVYYQTGVLNCNAVSFPTVSQPIVALTRTDLGRLSLEGPSSLNNSPTLRTNAAVVFRNSLAIPFARLVTLHPTYYLGFVRVMNCRLGRIC